MTVGHLSGNLPPLKRFGSDKEIQGFSFSTALILRRPSPKAMGLEGCSSSRQNAQVAMTARVGLIECR
jgi:hypothetical protein